MQHPDEGTIHAWLDGALAPAEARAFEEHVTGCTECEAAVANARGLLAASSRILSALDHVPAGAVPRAGSAGGATTAGMGGSHRAGLEPGGFRAMRWRAAAAIALVAGVSWLALQPHTPQGDVASKPVTEQAVAATTDTSVIVQTPQVAEIVPHSAAPSSARSAVPAAPPAVQSNKTLASSSIASDASAPIAAKRAMVPRAEANDAALSGAVRTGGLAGGIPKPSSTASVPTAGASGASSGYSSRLDERQSAEAKSQAETSSKREAAMNRVAQNARTEIDSILASDSSRREENVAADRVTSRDFAMQKRAAAAPSAVAKAMPSRVEPENVSELAAGCYVVETSDWLPADGARTTRRLPARIELEQTLGLSGDERGNHLARPAPGEPPLPPGTIGFWKPLGDDRIRVTFADERGWTVLTLDVTAASLRGPARSFAASDGTLRSSDVIAHRTSCQ
jgi:hypothetical protein